MSSNTDIKRIEYTFKPIGDEKFFFGYQFIVTYTNTKSFTIEQSYPIEDQRVVLVDLDLNDILSNSKILLHTKSAQGKHVRLAISAGNNVPRLEIIEIPVSSLANATINVAVDAIDQLPNPPVKGSYQMKGKLISNGREAKLDGYQVVIYAAIANLADGNPDFSPVAFATTETNGYFVTSFLVFNNPDGIINVKAGKATITNGDLKKEQAIKLIEKTEDEGETSVRKSMLPDRLILVIDETNEEEACEDCGCNDLNFHEKKVFEEYSYYTVVRTTEPSIIADVLEEEKDIDLEKIYGQYGANLIVPISVFRKFHTIESRQISPTNFLATIPSSVAAKPTGAGALSNNVLNSNTITETALGTIRPPFNRDLLEKLVLDHKVEKAIEGDVKPIFKGRTHLNQINQIDWDKDPTIYQAASVAHGHLLCFKQEWMPDGYSLGDLIYSLPLAPGQKKQIAVLDWERRESAANSQSLDYEETLNNSLVSDRDINEVVSGTLTENVSGNSKAHTRGIGFGLGGAVMGVFTGGSYGALMGISGGASSSGSDATQNSHRESTVSSLQNISDRTMQSASVVRSQRSTVVQTVSQGERVQATAESVANYNHCHAITIEYFEVLRHFAVHNRLAGVQECLFVPLQMAPFDIEKCLRWRNTLEKHLFKPELRTAFAAVERIQNEKESSDNYYDSIGFPPNNYAEQNINFYSGDLFIEFFFFNIGEEKITDDIIKFFSIFHISLDPLRDRKITDEELANHVGPRAIEYLLDAFTLTTDKGLDLKLDLTLISQFRQNAVLRVSVRKQSNTPLNIPRNQTSGINIKLNLNKLAKDQVEADTLTLFQDKYMKIRLLSGNLHYRTDHFSGTLFEGRIDNDIFAGSDGAFIDTSFLTPDELRNPRGEDVDAANNLLHHLNENMEYYHKCIFFDMTPERRFMLLDGIIAPGKANGRSVASVVENRVIGIAGNSLILPVAPGNQLDPTIDDKFDLFAQYFHDDPEPMRISVPTKGVYAESVMGQCNSCEEKDESRFWRWEESPIPDSPNTQILPLNTDTRRADPGDLQPKDFPNPIVNIQNAPNLPDPTGLQAMLQLLGKGDSFRDLTGLNQNQLNALATFQKSLDTAQAFGKEAAELAKAAAANKLIEDGQKRGAVSNAKAKELTEKNIKAAIPLSKEETMNQAQKQLDLINTLEQQGGLQAKDAQSARKNILDNLTKGLDTSGTSAGELGNLMEKASTFGTDVKKDADGFEITAKTQTTNPLVIDISITPSLRAFGPPSDLTDKTKLSVKAANASAEAKLVWSIPPTEAGKYTITQKMIGEISEVEITGIQPGLTAIGIALIDGGKVIASQRHALSIPQFITIDDKNIKLDAFIAAHNFQAVQDQILDQARQIVDLLLVPEANVRLIYKSQGKAVPAHIPANFITKASIENQDPSGDGGYADSKGTAHDGDVGDTFFDEVVKVFPESYFDQNPVSTDVDAATNELVSIITSSQSSDPGLEQWVIKFIGRLIGETLSHELYHTLLPVPFIHNVDASNHIIDTADIMDDGKKRSFLERTGIVAHSTLPGDFLDNLTDNGIVAINKLTDVNLASVHSHFPIPPTAPFDK